MDSHDPTSKPGDRSKSKRISGEGTRSISGKVKRAKPTTKPEKKVVKGSKKTAAAKIKPASISKKNRKTNKSPKDEVEEGQEEMSDSYRDGSQADKESDSSSRSSGTLEDDYTLETPDSGAEESDDHSRSSGDSEEGDEELSDSGSSRSGDSDSNSDEFHSDDPEHSSRDKSSKSNSKKPPAKKKSFVSKELLDKLRKEGLGLENEEKSVGIGGNGPSKAKQITSSDKIDSKKKDENELNSTDRQMSSSVNIPRGPSRMKPESKEASAHSRSHLDISDDEDGDDHFSEHGSSSASSDISPNENEDAHDYEVGGYHPVYIGELYKQGRYRVVKKLGYGHFSTVWMAEDKQAPSKGLKWVALKIQKSKKNHNEAALDEVRLLQQIKDCSTKDGWHLSCAQIIKSRPHLEPLVVLREGPADSTTSGKQTKNKKGGPKKTDKTIQNKRKLPSFPESDSQEPAKPPVPPEDPPLAQDRPQLYENFTVQLLDCFAHQGPHGEHQVAVFPLLGPTMLEVIRFFEKRSRSLYEEFLSKRNGFKYPYMKYGAPSGIPAPIVQSMLQQMLLGFHFLHTYARIIHTDLKPENVLVVLGDEAVEVLDEIGKIPDQSQLTETLSQKIASPNSTAESNKSSIPLSQKFLMSKADDPQYKRLYQEMLECQKKPGGGKGRKTTANKFLKFIQTKKSQLKDDEENCSFIFWWKGIIPVRLSASTKVRIADLGNGCYLSKHFTESIQTREYRAPEALVGQPYSSSTDLWSLGCMVYEMMTGDYLFRPESLSGESLKDMAHLKLIQDTLGAIPRSVISGSVRQHDYFTKEYKVKRLPKRRDYRDFDNGHDSEDSRSEGDLKVDPVPQILSMEYEMDEEAALEFYLGIRPMLEYSSERRDRAWNILQRRSWIWGDVGFEQKTRWINRYKQQLGDHGFDLKNAHSLLGKRNIADLDAPNNPLDEDASDSEEEKLDEKTLELMAKHLDRGLALRYPIINRSKEVINLASPRRPLKGAQPVFDPRIGTNQRKLQMVALEMSRSRLAQDLLKSNRAAPNQDEEIDSEREEPNQAVKVPPNKLAIIKESNRIYGSKHSTIKFFPEENELEDEEMLDPEIPQHYSSPKPSSKEEAIMNLKKSKSFLDQKMRRIGLQEKQEPPTSEGKSGADTLVSPKLSPMAGDFSAATAASKQQNEHSTMEDEHRASAD